MNSETNNTQSIYEVPMNSYFTPYITDDKVTHNCRHDKVLVQKSTTVVTVSLKEKKITILRHFSTDRPM